MRTAVSIQSTLLGLVLLSIMGCTRSGPVPVAGTVILDGQPVTGHIVFVPADSAQAKRGGAIENGRYEITADRGPIPGPHRVEIYARKKTGRMIEGADAEQSTDETVEMIPSKYNRESTLTANLKSGPNQLDFSLTQK